MVPSTHPESIVTVLPMRYDHVRVSDDVATEQLKGADAFALLSVFNLPYPTSSLRPALTVSLCSYHGRVTTTACDPSPREGRDSNDFGENQHGAKRTASITRSAPYLVGLSSNCVPTTHEHSLLPLKGCLCLEDFLHESVVHHLSPTLAGPALSLLHPPQNIRRPRRS